MSFGRFLLRRALSALLLVVLASSASLVLTTLAPGDFTVEDAFGRDPEAVAAQRQRLGLDRPLVRQYADWAGRVVRLDFGTSLLYTRPVADLVAERALNTAVLATAALLLATAVGIPLGIYTGIRRGAAAAVIRGLSVVLLSLPPLLASLVLIIVAARTGLAPVGGMASAGAETFAWGAWLADLAWHLPVPALALALPLMATLERLQSQAMSAAVREPFVRAAAARGLSADRAALVHGWRASLAGVLGIYGLMIGSVFSGSFVVEVVTSWPGLGRLMYDALRARDLYLVAGCAGAGALCLAAGTLLADVLLGIADPRARARGHA